MPQFLEVTLNMADAGAFCGMTVNSMDISS